MTADTITAIKKALEDFAPMTLEFTPTSSEGNSIIRPTDEFEGRYFTVIGCGDKQDALGQTMTLAVNALPELLSTLESLQRDNEAMKRDRYDLAYAITGGEDAPGLLDSVPTSQLVEIARNTHRSHSADIDRAEAAEAEIKRLREAPDYCLDPKNWEFTSDWAERDQVHGYGEGLKIGEPMEVETLIRGPRKWVADVPITWDEDGDADETEIQWFDSEEAARTALASTGGEHHAE